MSFPLSGGLGTFTRWNVRSQSAQKNRLLILAASLALAGRTPFRPCTASALTKPAVLAQAELHYDASDAGTLTFLIADNGDGTATTNVTGWANKGIVRGLDASVPYGFDPPRYTGGILDFGPKQTKRDMRFTEIGDIRTIFWVIDIAQDESAFLLGHSQAHPFIRGVNGEYCSEEHAAGGVKNGAFRNNGIKVDSPSAAVIPAGPRVISFVAAADSGGLKADSLTCDRGGVDEWEFHRYGGRKLAELAIFSTRLPDADRQAVERYLMEKWASWRASRPPPPDTEAPPFPAPVIGGYYAGGIAPGDWIDRRYTILFNAFLRVEAGGIVSWPDPALVGQGHGQGALVLLSLGNGTRFDDETATPGSLAGYVDTVAAYVDRLDYDGIDVDWEHPREKPSARRWSDLMRALRAALDGIGARKHRKMYLTTALAPMDWAWKHTDYAVFQECLDYINVMCYDIVWGVSTYHAPLGANPSEPAQRNFVWLLDRMARTTGAPRSKLIIGLPFYGEYFHTDKPFVKVGDWGQLSYNDALKSTAGFSRGYEANSAGVWCWSPDGQKLVIYDSPRSIYEKTKHYLGAGYGGVFSFHILCDRMDDGSHPLTAAMIRAARERAGTFIWAGGDGLWGDGAKWEPADWRNGNHAIFRPGGGGTVGVDVAAAAASLAFNGGCTLTNAGGAVQIDGPVTVADGGTAAILAPVSGIIEKSGAGTFVFDPAQADCSSYSFAGPVSLNGGTLTADFALAGDAVLSNGVFTRATAANWVASNSPMITVAADAALALGGSRPDRSATLSAGSSGALTAVISDLLAEEPLIQAAAVPSGMAFTFYDRLGAEIPAGRYTLAVVDGRLAYMPALGLAPPFSVRLDGDADWTTAAWADAGGRPVPADVWGSADEARVAAGGENPVFTLDTDVAAGMIEFLGDNALTLKIQKGKRIIAAVKNNASRAVTIDLSDWAFRADEFATARDLRKPVIIGAARGLDVAEDTIPPPPGGMGVRVDRSDGIALVYYSLESISFDFQTPDGDLLADDGEYGAFPCKGRCWNRLVTNSLDGAEGWMNAAGIDVDGFRLSYGGRKVEPQVSAADGYDPLLQGQLVDDPNAPGFITLENVPYEAYDLYVYKGSGAQDAGWDTFSPVLLDGVYYRPDGTGFATACGQTEGWGDKTVKQVVPGPSGNVMIFTNLVGDVTILLPRNDAQGQRANIPAFQIVNGGRPTGMMRRRGTVIIMR